MTLPVQLHAEIHLWLSRAASSILTQVNVAFPGHSLEAREIAVEESVPISPVPLEPRLADLDDSAALPETTEEETE